MFSGAWFTGCYRKKNSDTAQYQYLYYVIAQTSVYPQKISIFQKDLRALIDFQELLEDINWICSSRGISNFELSNLFHTGRGLCLQKR